MEKTEKLAVNFDEMCSMLSIGKNLGYELIHQESFPKIALTSKKYIFPVSGLMEWLEKQAEAVAE